MAQIRLFFGTKTWSESVLWQRFRFGMVSTTSLSLSMRGRYKIEIAEWEWPHIFQNKRVRYPEDRRLHQRILKQTSTRFAELWRCTWTRIRRQSVTVTTRYFFSTNSSLTRASASRFGERYRDVLSQNLDENNSNKYSLLYSSMQTIQLQYGCVCSTSSVLGTPILYSM